MTTRCQFVSDLHGRPDRYEKLLAVAEAERPGAIFLGGDLLPSGWRSLSTGDFLPDWLAPRLEGLRSRLGPEYPRVIAVFGNDDPRAEEASLARLERRGLVEHAHGRRIALGPHPVYGYACVPPTPFALKDCERYDVSRFVDPGGVSPEEGWCVAGPHRPDALPLRRPRRPRAGPGSLRDGAPGGGDAGAVVGPVIPTTFVSRPCHSEELRLEALSFRGATSCRATRNPQPRRPAGSGSVPPKSLGRRRPALALRLRIPRDPSRRSPSE